MTERKRIMVSEKNKLCRLEQMRAGYLEMGKINLALADEFHYCEEEANLLIEKTIVQLISGNI